MTTFTATSHPGAGIISVDSSRILSEIKDEIYSGFTEHMGRCIYGGIYDPGNPLSDENGFRKDVIESVRELNVPVVRYPGGNFVATYHWLDGVGPKEQRPKRPELAWLGVESNEFGTDEFLKWCEVVGTEPYFALNFGTGTLDEALAWVEYCNGEKDTYYANLRRKNGREKPYNVKYWALGNEMWGPWQIGQLTKEDYAKKATQWAKALKLLDPTLILILCGETGYSDWDRYVLQECIQFVDMHSIHIYTADKSHLANVTAPLSAERAIEMSASLIDLARIIKGVEKRPTICFDEWNVWDPVRAPGELGGEELYTLSDALAVATWLNVFVRQSKWMGMANIAQTVNVISPLMTHPKGVTKQTTYWPLYLASKYLRGRTLGVHVSCEQYKGKTNPVWLASTMDIPSLDVAAALDKEGWVNLSVVNIKDDGNIKAEIKGVEKANGSVQVFTVTGNDINVVNKLGDDKHVVVKESKWDGKGEYIFPKHSYTLLRWKE